MAKQMPAPPVEPASHGARYVTLLLRNEKGRWEIAYGAYDRADVIAERNYYREDRAYAAKDLTIIVTSDKQADIEAAVAKLNEAAK